VHGLGCIEGDAVLVVPPLMRLTESLLRRTPVVLFRLAVHSLVSLLLAVHLLVPAKAERRMKRRRAV